MATTVNVKVGLQANQTTPATSFVCVEGENMPVYRPAYDRASDRFKFSCTPVARATAKKSPTTLLGYLVRGDALSNEVTADAIGYWLLGAGFKVSSTTDTPEVGANTHVFTLAEESALKWLTIRNLVGDTAGTGFENEIVGVRSTELSFTDDKEGFTYSVSNLGLTIAKATGTPTETNEDATKLVRYNGSISIIQGANTLVNSASQTGKHQGLTINIANPVDEEDFGMRQLTRAGLPQQGVDVTGTLDGIELLKTNWEMVVWGSAGATAPGGSSFVAAYLNKYTSTGNIASTSTKYSIEFSLPSVEFYLDSDPSASGQGKVRGDFSWQMIDNVSQPITVTLINARSAYS